MKTLKAVDIKQILKKKKKKKLTKTISNNKKHSKVKTSEGIKKFGEILLASEI